MSTEIIRQSQPPEALQRIALDPQALITHAIDKGVDVGTLEKLVALAKDVQAQRARSAWYAAMAEFQRRCPPIKKNETAQIRTDKGAYSYAYATLDEIMSTILPVMGELGLSVSYRVKHEAEKVIASARVSHEMGHHEESGEVPVPIEKGGMGANSAQRIGIASSYAKRYALLAIIGLAPEKDTDAGSQTGPTVAAPRRKSDPDVQPAATHQAGEVWSGTVKSVTHKDGTTNGKPWTLYTITGNDGTTFNTFDSKAADFAREAGSGPVDIAWETTAKGGKKVMSIEPATREPGDEEPGD